MARRTASVGERELVRLGPWPLGVDNLDDETELPTDDNGRPVALREALNLDLDRKGNVRSRVGQTRVFVGLRSHSLWSAQGMPFALVVDEDELCAFFEDERVEPIGLPMAAGKNVSYDLVGESVYWTNEVESGVVSLDLVARPWATPAPGGNPAAAAVDGYGLQAGTYRVALTFSDASGRESGTGPGIHVTVADGQGIELTGLPPADPAQVSAINVYMTGPDGTVLNRFGKLDPDAQAVVIDGPARGRPLAEAAELLVTMPPGQIVRFHNGRQYLARAHRVLWSPAMRYGLHDPARGGFSLPGRITMMEPVGAGTEGAGIYVAAGEVTYYVAGSTPDGQRLQRVVEAGVVPWTSMRVPGDKLGFETTQLVAFWLGKNGTPYAGLPGGTIVPMNTATAAIDGAEAGAVLLRESRGMRQALFALRAPAPQGISIGDTAVAHIIHSEKP